MNSSLIVLTGIAFALGLVISMLQTRRRIRRQINERLVAEAENRIRAEVLKRVQSGITPSDATTAKHRPETKSG